MFGSVSHQLAPLTFPNSLLGLLSWVAFIYIGLRVRRIRWILWGLLYSMVFIAVAITSRTAGPGSDTANATVALMIVVGIVSVVHAFLVRNDYLVLLENRIQEAAETEALRRRRLETEYSSRAEEPSPSESSAQPESAESSATGTGPREPVAPETTDKFPSIAVSALAPVKAEAGSSSRTDGLAQAYSISESYPLPIAFTWSLLATLWDPKDRYSEQLRHAEHMVTFLGSMSLALLEKQDYKEAEINPKGLWGTGSTFGGWNRVVKGSSKVFRRYEDNPLASAIQELGADSPEESSFGADVAALVSARNDYSHGRGPSIEEETVVASNEVQKRLQRCMEALSFLTQYPIRLVQDFDVDRRSGEFLLKCLRFVGDGPGFPQEKVVYPRALPRGDLFLDLGHQNWIQLYPFVIALNCLRCQHRETYFIDRWDYREGTASVKSFERGHIEERRDVCEYLSALAG